MSALKSPWIATKAGLSSAFPITLSVMGKFSTAASVPFSSSFLTTQGLEMFTHNILMPDFVVKQTQALLGGIAS